MGSAGSAAGAMVTVGKSVICSPLLAECGRRKLRIETLDVNYTYRHLAFIILDRYKQRLIGSKFIKLWRTDGAGSLELRGYFEVAVLNQNII